MIPAKKYKEIVSLVPILCTDVVLWQGNRCLMVKRAKSPLLGKWGVVGGRVHLNESLEEACTRIVKEEVGLDVIDPFFLCFWESVFDEGEHGPIHTVSAVHEGYIDESVNIAKTIKLDSQATEWRLTKRGPPEELGV